MRARRGSCREARLLRWWLFESPHWLASKVVTAELYLYLGLLQAGALPFYWLSLFYSNFGCSHWIIFRHFYKWRQIHWTFSHLGYYQRSHRFPLVFVGVSSQLGTFIDLLGLLIEIHQLLYLIWTEYWLVATCLGQVKLFLYSRPSPTCIRHHFFWIIQNYSNN